MNLMGKMGAMLQQMVLSLAFGLRLTVNNHSI
jgi:hypothetical protein